MLDLGRVGFVPCLIMFAIARVRFFAPLGGRMLNLRPPMISHKLMPSA
jgi:hypothetical protein